MLSLVKHAGLALKFKFLTLEEYRYSLPVIGTILFVLALIQSVGFSQFFEATTNTLIALALIVTVIKYLCIVIILQTMLLGKQQNPRRNLFGFILMTEAMFIPVAFAFFIPVLGLVSLIWQLYIFIVQFRGLIYFSGKKVISIVVAYLVTLIVSIFVIMPVFMVFDSLDLIDIQQFQEKVLESMKANQ